MVLQVTFEQIIVISRSMKNVISVVRIQRLYLHSTNLKFRYRHYRPLCMGKYHKGGLNFISCTFAMEFHAHPPHPIGQFNGQKPPRSSPHPQAMVCAKKRYFTVMAATHILLHLILSLVALLSHGPVTPTQAFGVMGTLAPMWGQFDPTQDSSTKGTYHMCVIEAGSLLPHCLGNMSRNSSVTLVDPPKDTPFLALSAGAQFTCGLIYGSQVPLCWGDLDNNKLAVPEKLQKVSYSTIASGAYHVCALRSGAAAAVDCWGGKSNGESQPPVNGGPYVSLTSGWDFSCALTALGRAVCWGALTNRTFTHNHAEPNTSFDAIFAGRSYVCGVERQTGNATCWGDNSYSQSNVPPYTRFKTIAPSMFHTCGLIRDTGVADCWGDDFYSQVNATSLGVTFSTLAAGDFYTCGVNAEDLAVRCWGNGVQGTKDFARVKVAPTVCRAARCSKHQYQLPSSFCPGMGNYKACVDCTPGLCGKRKNVITLAVLCVVLVLTVVLVAAGFTILEFRRKKLAKAVLADQEPDLELLEYEKQAKRVKEYTQQELSLATVVAWVEKVASEFSSLVPALDMEPPVDEEKSRILAEVLELGVCCVRPKAIDRPTMTVVASSLEKVLKHFGNPSSAREWISSPWTETTSGPSTVDGPSTLEASFSSSFLAEIRLVSPKWAPQDLK
ncbi:hypothetical protein SELMODRAFT_416993 [Selaginella moellendorffii]|uniref:non-specific serine/threonine protein kinase n=1 Tax=Selaginella moellendorffii TaxID=88036 RepID=D8S117_SELML|nr:hypothetical protein SELMODRAFT_416993 [Selaginella moellendorffii]